MSTKKNPTHRKAITLVTQICSDKEAMDNAKLTQALLPRLALEAFRINRAKSSDWLMLQYWLYYAEALVSLFNTENPTDRIEMGVVVGESIQALYSIGRRYNESKFTVMTATEEDVVVINLGLTIMDAYKEVMDERTLVTIGEHIQRVLQVK